MKPRLKPIRLNPLRGRLHFSRSLPRAGQFLLRAPNFRRRLKALRKMQPKARRQLLPVEGRKLLLAKGRKLLLAARRNPPRAARRRLIREALRKILPEMRLKILPESVLKMKTKRNAERGLPFRGAAPRLLKTLRDGLISSARFKGSRGRGFARRLRADVPRAIIVPSPLRAQTALRARITLLSTAVRRGRGFALREACVLRLKGRAEPAGLKFPPLTLLCPQKRAG